jgi:stage V sporulation protein SpoVS
MAKQIHIDVVLRPEGEAEVSEEVRTSVNGAIKGMARALNLHMEGAINLVNPAMGQVTAPKEKTGPTFLEWVAGLDDVEKLYVIEAVNQAAAAELAKEMATQVKS